MLQVAICARPANTGSTCSTEEDAKSRPERMRDDAAKMKAARNNEGCTPMVLLQHAELVVKRRDGVSREPTALEQKTFRVENGVLVGQEMGRINVHKTRTSRSSSVQCTMGNLNAYKHADRLPIWSMRSRYVACGCGKLGLCITASTQQSVIKSCSWCPMQRKPRTRISKALSTVSTRSAPPSQTSQDATAM